MCRRVDVPIDWIFINSKHGRVKWPLLSAIMLNSVFDSICDVLQIFDISPSHTVSSKKTYPILRELVSQEGAGFLDIGFVLLLLLQLDLKK